MLFCSLFCISQAKKISFSTAASQKVITFDPVTRKSLSSLSDYNCWNYLYLPKKHSKELLTNINISILPENQITSCIHVIYTNPKKLISMANNDNEIYLKKISPEEKYIHNVNHDIHSNESDLYVYVNDELPSSSYFKVLYNISQNLYLIKTIRLPEAIDYLSALPNVLFITPYVINSPLNLFASGFTQHNTKSPNVENGIESFDRFINKKGFSGEGEVITILDSLIDFNHSLFYDPDSPMKFNEPLTNHRKFVFYKFAGTNEDFTHQIKSAEHGTHVGGTAAGKNICNDIYLNHLNGVAPESKILYAGNFNDPTGKNIFEHIKLMNSYNSSISSNSWGSNYGTIFNNWLYGQAYIFPYQLFIFAAGNEKNDSQISEYFTISEPGGNKNVLTVGAISSISDIAESNDFLMIDTKNEHQTINIKLLNNSGSNTIHDISLSVSEMMKIVDYENNNNMICEIINNSIVTVLFGRNLSIPVINCSHIDHFSNLATFYTSNYNMLDAYKSHVQYVTIQKVIKANRSITYESAFYSSAGPAYKGILKPDVVAPGTFIVSARSQSLLGPHGCMTTIGTDYYANAGTSMSTPNVAGAAALVRQYFLKERNLNLLGCELRALLIASASKPDRSKTPDMFIGHGIIDLSKILSFESSFGCAISNNQTFISNSNHLITKIKVINKNSPLRIVLSYLDVELNIESMIPIVNDLDLVVISPKGNQKYRGNHRDDKDSEHFSTNEKVIINQEELEIGEYEIHIYSNVEIGTMFSVVAVGPIMNQELFFERTLKCGCDKCSTNGKCKCDSYHIGNDCQLDIIHINEYQSSIKINHNSIKHLRLNFDNIQFIEIDRPDSINGSYSNVWWSYKCHSSLSNYESVISLNENRTILQIDSDSSICLAIFNNHFNDQEFKIIIYTGDSKQSITNTDWKNIAIILFSILLALLLIIIITLVIIGIKKLYSTYITHTDDSSAKELNRLIYE